MHFTKEKIEIICRFTKSYFNLYNTALFQVLILGQVEQRCFSNQIRITLHWFTCRDALMYKIRFISTRLYAQNAKKRPCWETAGAPLRSWQFNNTFVLNLLFWRPFVTWGTAPDVLPGLEDSFQGYASSPGSQEASLEEKWESEQGNWENLKIETWTELLTGMWLDTQQQEKEKSLMRFEWEFSIQKT